MVLFRGSNPIGPANRDEKGPAEELDDRVKTYIKMGDDEWNALYEKMYSDRKYPGHNNLKLALFPSLFYVAGMGMFSYELYLKRASLLAQKSNVAKLASIPVFGLLLSRNLDIAKDIWTFRNKYPEMYQS